MSIPSNTHKRVLTRVNSPGQLVIDIPVRRFSLYNFFNKYPEIKKNIPKDRSVIIDYIEEKILPVIYKDGPESFGFEKYYIVLSPKRYYSRSYLKKFTTAKRFLDTFIHFRFTKQERSNHRFKIHKSYTKLNINLIDIETNIYKSLMRDLKTQIYFYYSSDDHIARYVSLKLGIFPQKWKNNNPID